MTTIKWEEPPAARVRGTMDEIVRFVTALEGEPGRWAFFKGGYSQGNCVIRWRQKFPHIEWVTRKMDDGRYGVWARFTGAA